LFPIVLLLSYRDLRHLHSFPTRRSSDLFASSVRSRDSVALCSQSGSHLCALFSTSSATADRGRVWRPPRGSNIDPDELVQFRLGDRKSTRLNSSHVKISYAVFCLKKKKK